MSNLGKILLWVALIGALVAVVLGFFVSQDYTKARNDRDASLAREAADQVKIKAQDGQIADLTTERDGLKTQLTAANSKIDDLTSQLTQSQNDLKKANDALTTATQNGKDLQDKLDAINKTLGGQTADEVVADRDKAKSDLAAAQQEIKVLNDTVDAAKAKINDLFGALNREKTGNIPPGVSGKVTFVDRTWNFVVLDVGEANGLVPNGELIVYRGRTFLGKLKVTKVDNNDAVAEIMPDIKGDIQVGDVVIN